jgi:hypothetical protein
MVVAWEGSTGLLCMRRGLMGRDRYDVIHFEALGPEASHLEEETAKAKGAGLLQPTDV